MGLRNSINATTKDPAWKRSQFKNVLQILTKRSYGSVSTFWTTKQSLLQWFSLQFCTALVQSYREILNALLPQKLFSIQHFYWTRSETQQLILDLNLVILTGHVQESAGIRHLKTSYLVFLVFQMSIGSSSNQYISQINFMCNLKYPSSHSLLIGAYQPSLTGYEMVRNHLNSSSLHTRSLWSIYQ